MMRTGVRAVIATLLSMFASTALVQPAQAAVPGARTGVDVSWPQCHVRTPAGFAFAVVGVNGGTASTTNPCLADQLGWASSSTTGTAPNQPRVQLYVNTANPGQVLEEYAVTTWPIDDVDPRGSRSGDAIDIRLRNPYGACTATATAAAARGIGTNDLACSWQYGWNRAVESVDKRLSPAARAAGLSEAASDYTWWLDVETMNSWQEGYPAALARNTATLEGMAQFYLSEGVRTVGLYSTGYQWSQIVGSTLDVDPGGAPVVGGALLGLPSWLAGASDTEDASRTCFAATGLTGGPVVMVQHIVEDLDHNESCA